MASRIGSGTDLPSVGLPTGIPVDGRRDMMKELLAAQLVAQLADVQSVLREVVTRGEAQTNRTGQLVDKGERQATETRVDRRVTDVFDRGAKTDALRAAAPPAAGAPPTTTPPPTSEQVQRALQNLQRDAGLPVTGRFDDATARLLVKLGIAGQPPTTTAPPPATPPADQKPADQKPAEKKPVEPATQAAQRQVTTGQEQQVKARLQPLLPSPPRPEPGRAAPTTIAPQPPAAPTTSPPATSRPESPAPRTALSSSTAAKSPEPPREKPVDRVVDPARLLVSLFAAGFQGKGPEQALSSFQAAQKLPVTGQLDPRTLDALAAAGHVSPEAAAAHQETQAASTSSAASATASASSSSSAAGASADKARTESARLQASTTTSDATAASVVARAQASSPEEARERARLDSLLAQAAAKERGVQESKGDPAALAGHGAQAGLSTGLSGRGGTGGGAPEHGEEGALSADDGSRGDESSNANAHAGDDDHEDGRRGDAVDAVGGDDDDGVLPDGHYRVPRLADQVRAALNAIARLDDTTAPVHYSWDVSLHRPGVYAAGQPAEVVWHLVVDRAHAFDPVWQRAVDAIGARLLYVEPDADPVTLDDVLGALRRARVR